MRSTYALILPPPPHPPFEGELCWMSWLARLLTRFPLLSFFLLLLLVCIYILARKITRPLLQILLRLCVLVCCQSILSR